MTHSPFICVVTHYSPSHHAICALTTPEHSSSPSPSRPHRRRPFRPPSSPFAARRPIPLHPAAASQFQKAGLWGNMATTWLQRMITIGGGNLVSTTTVPNSRFFSKSTPYAVKVGIPEFLNGIGNGVESHVAKLESEIGDFHKLLVTRTLKLKKLGVPCKHRKLILKYAHKYRLGLWRPRAGPIKA